MAPTTLKAAKCWRRRFDSSELTEEAGDGKTIELQARREGPPLLSTTTRSA
jgi:hypothetical protein